MRGRSDVAPQSNKHATRSTAQQITPMRVYSPDLSALLFLLNLEGSAMTSPALEFLDLVPFPIVCTLVLSDACLLKPGIARYRAAAGVISLFFCFTGYWFWWGQYA